MSNEPQFRTEKDQLILQCSECHKDIRLVDDKEGIDLSGPFYCANCFEPGEAVQVFCQKMEFGKEPEDYWRDAIYLSKENGTHTVQYEDGTNEILNYKNQIRKSEKYPDLKSIEEIKMAKEIERLVENRPESEKQKLIKAYINEKKQWLEGERADLDNKSVIIEALEDLADWCEAHEEQELKLEKNDCSRLHRLREAAADGKVHAETVIEFPEFENTFVVKHDWGGVLGGAQVDGGEGIINLPYDGCFFEFRIWGRTIICVCKNISEEVDGFAFAGFVECINNVWTPILDKERMSAYDKIDGELNNFFLNQIRAICIALDAEVAAHEVVRAPTKLNQKREQKGKTKLSDYHIIDLSRRHRISNPGNGESGTKKRLHFRRGHWRHYQESKTWVKWCLVGDPDLGFVNKHYKL